MDVVVRGINTMSKKPRPREPITINQRPDQQELFWAQPRLMSKRQRQYAAGRFNLIGHSRAKPSGMGGHSLDI